MQIKNTPSHSPRRIITAFYWDKLLRATRSKKETLNKRACISYTALLPDTLQVWRQWWDVVKTTMKWAPHQEYTQPESHSDSKQRYIALQINNSSGTLDSNIDSKPTLKEGGVF